MTPPQFSGPLHELVANAHGNHARVVELLDTHPDLLEARFADWDETPMEAAAHTGSRAIAEELERRGATPTVPALAMLGRAGTLRALLADRPELAQVSGAHGISLLFHAALSGDPETLQTVWDAGARVGLDHALHGAINARSPEALAWLLEQGAGVTATDWQGKTPEQAARERGLDDLAGIIAARA
ncbi:ankyrin repeat domain-containing protein [Deinococcus pimensis]|uniref:ankyrin repeat domain-containing protein n=1 Tax=Deinococcus pimensis TaxID=309888 RepID=UPI0004B711DB|nr:ankyrin repeat domain-containing protein [Deinococcus pimensis]